MFEYRTAVKSPRTDRVLTQAVRGDRIERLVQVNQSRFVHTHFERLEPLVEWFAGVAGIEQLSVNLAEQEIQLVYMAPLPVQRGSLISSGGHTAALGRESAKALAEMVAKRHQPAGNGQCLLLLL